MAILYQTKSIKALLMDQLMIKFGIILTFLQMLIFQIKYYKGNTLPVKWWMHQICNIKNFCLSNVINLNYGNVGYITGFEFEITPE